MPTKGASKKTRRTLEEVPRDAKAALIESLVNIEIENAFEGTLPAMIYNQFAPSYDWYAGFKRTNEYLDFADSLVGKESWGHETLTKYIQESLEDYYSSEEIKEYEDYYGREEGRAALVEKVRNQLTLNDVISILAPKLMKFITDERNRKRIREWIVNNFNIHWRAKEVLEELSLRAEENWDRDAQFTITVRRADSHEHKQSKNS
jgi:hypothetical protein